MTDLSTFPDLVLYKIFQFVKGPRKLKWFKQCECGKLQAHDGRNGSLLDLRMVCKRFHAMAKDPRLLTELRIHPKISIDDLTRAFEERPLLHELVINFSCDSFPAGPLGFPWNDDGNSWETNPEKFLDSVKNLKRLKTLKVEGVCPMCSNGSWGTSLDSSFFKAFQPSVTTLHLVNIDSEYNWKEFELESFGSSIKSLKIVNHMGNPIGLNILLEKMTMLDELDIDKIPEDLILDPVLPRLKSLTLDLAEFIPDQYLEVVKSCKSLEKLVLKRNGRCPYLHFIKEEMNELKKKMNIKIFWKKDFRSRHLYI